MAIHNNTDSQSEPCFISHKGSFVLTLCFLAAVFIARKITLLTCAKLVAFDCPSSWPISVFRFIYPQPQRFLVAVFVLIFFALSVTYLERKNYCLSHTIVTGILLIIGSNLIQGWQVGLYAPISGSAYSGELVPITNEGQEFYHDAIRITDPLQLFRNYNHIQATLNQHSHTHPPGALLLICALLKLLRHPGFVAIFIAILSASLSSFFLYKMLTTEVKPHAARYVTFLFMMLPAIQIYYLATLDALIASLLLGTLYFFRQSNERKYLFLSCVLLSLSFSLTFVSLFILPVLVGFELIERRSLIRSLILLSTLLGFHLALYFLFGYNALQAFHIASAHENPEGFILFVNPVNYFFTRLENIMELLVFFGPFLLLLFVWGVKRSWTGLSKLFTLSALGMGTLTVMFVTGAFRTGETARASIFIFPYLLFPVALYLESVKLNREQRLLLIGFVFMQTIVMQIVGNYFY